jgi:hypothetical protein
MHVVFGIILGILLTIGLAYFVDSRRPGDGRPLVNWDEVNIRVRNISAAVQSAWGRLTKREKN